ncbi:MAG: hypothetical protein ACI9V1_002008 [Spirosomataceae bacterium]|jgi:hypothetical protein
MKRLNKTFNYFLVTLLTFTVGTAMSQMIASDKKVDVDMSDFKTFDWVSNDANFKTGFFEIIEDAVYTNEIKQAVKYELEARSYNHSNNDSDLLVTFKVLQGSAEYMGFSEGSITSTTFDDEVRQKGYRETYMLDKGTLLIALIDKKTGKLVWQGFASGVMDGDIYDKGDTKVKEAVNDIFGEEFNYSAGK